MSDSPLMERLKTQLERYRTARATIDTKIARLVTAIEVLVEEGGEGEEIAVGALPVQQSPTITPHEPSAPAPLPPHEERRTDLKGCTIIQAATAILRESGQALHYREIAVQACERGYKSGRGTDFERLATSFSQTLRREASDEGPLKTEGGGRFILVNGAATS